MKQMTNEERRAQAHKLLTLRETIDALCVLHNKGRSMSKSLNTALDALTKVLVP